MKINAKIVLGAIVGVETVTIAYLIKKYTDSLLVTQILSNLMSYHIETEKSKENKHSREAEDASIEEEYETEVKNDIADEMEESSIGGEFPTESNDDIFEELEESGIEENFVTEDNHNDSSVTEDDSDELDFDSLEDLDSDEDDTK